MRTLSTKMLSEVHKFVTTLKTALAYGHKVPASDLHRAVLMVDALDGSEPSRLYRAISLRIEALRGSAEKASRPAGGHRGESSAVLELIAQRAQLAILLANRAAGLPDGHGVEIKGHKS